MNKIFGVVSKPIDKKETIKKDSLWMKFFKLSPIGQICDLVESFIDHSIQTVIDTLVNEGYD